ncbi:MAG: hypothetical protein ACP5NQ_07740 [Vulcanisaeta sp.]
MDELNEEAKTLLRRVLERGRISYDSLSEGERKVLDELVRLGYVKLYVEPNGRKIADALRMVGPIRRVQVVRRRYVCLGIVAIVFSLFLYLSVRAFLIDYLSVGVFFLIVSAVMVYIIYLVLRRYYPECVGFH